VPPGPGGQGPLGQKVQKAPRAGPARAAMAALKSRHTCLSARTSRVLGFRRAGASRKAPVTWRAGTSGVFRPGPSSESGLPP